MERALEIKHKLFDIEMLKSDDVEKINLPIPVSRTHLEDYNIALKK
jgi:hypothetical protein